MDAITIIREILRGGPIETAKLMSVCDILGITYDIYAPKCGEYGTIQKNDIKHVYQLVACNNATRGNTVYSYLINPREDYYYYNMVLVFGREDIQRVLPKLLNKSHGDVSFPKYNGDMADLITKSGQAYIAKMYKQGAELIKEFIKDKPIDQTSLYKALLSSKIDWRDNPPLAERPHYHIPEGIDFSIMGIDPIGDMDEMHVIKSTHNTGESKFYIDNPRINTYHNNCVEMNQIFKDLADTHHAIMMATMVPADMFGLKESGPMTTGKHSGYKPY